MKQALFSWRVWGVAIGGFIFVTIGLFYYAKTVYGVGPFGGTITSVTFCPVEVSYAIGVSGPYGGTYVYLPTGTELYEYYQVYRPGAWVLGMSVPGSSCRGWNDDGVYDLVSPAGYMLSVGTSF